MRLIIKTLLFLIPLVLISSIIDKNANDSFYSKKLASPIELINSKWVDSLLNSMSLKEKIGQLFMVPVYSNQNRAYEQKVLKQIQEYNIGGVILMKGSPYKHVNFTNKLQSVSNIPLMVAIDGEWGVAMRIDSIEPFPKAMTLGAIKNYQLVFDMGIAIADQCKRMGIHINFGPVLDVNSNYNNPIINMRAFGDNKTNVARKGLAYAMGMQNRGVLAVGKHFPGHGSTSTDSHKTLPVVYSSREHLYENEIFPFTSLINNELGGIMVAHISYPSFDKRFNRPASLSNIIIDSILKKELKFKGLIFTDALNMKGVTKNFKPGQIEVEALLAGNDVLLYSENLEIGINAVVYAVENGILSESQINEKCRKVLNAKQWFGLDNYKPVDGTNLLADLVDSKTKYLNQRLAENSITLIENKKSIIPFKELENKKILCISMGNNNYSEFQEYLTKYTKVDTINCSKWLDISQTQKILDTISYYTHIIISQHGVSGWPYKKFKLSESNIRLTEKIASLKPTIFSFFGNPYALKYYTNLDFFESIIIGYSNEQIVQKYLAQAIFGGIGINGTLPITINDKFKSGIGIETDQIRIKYSEPYEFELNDSVFFKADSIAQNAIEIKATPGCQILYAKNGKVLYNKSFGYQTYDKKSQIKSSNIYDIASVTKVAATTISLMALYDNNQFDPTAKLSNYLLELKRTDKKSIRINQILTHQSGLRSWIPFYKNTLDSKGELRVDLYKNDSSEQFSIKVAENLFLRVDYYDSIFKSILDTPIYNKKKYRYSDLGFYWMAKFVKQKTGSSIDRYAKNYFYDPLGMNNTFFNAWQFADKSLIVPTEIDNIYRRQKIVGYVHDPGAAMLGGVSGHAGLFSNANDLAKLGQLLLNKGTYGGKQYFKPKTLDVFNKSYFKRRGNRRAMGFDKPALKKGDAGPTCESASASSFGHSGFTGAYFWVDPENQSIFIFLSNRTYPNQGNNKLVEFDIRTKIQQVFYDVFEH